MRHVQTDTQPHRKHIVISVVSPRYFFHSRAREKEVHFSNTLMASDKVDPGPSQTPMLAFIIGFAHAEQPQQRKVGQMENSNCAWPRRILLSRFLFTLKTSK